MNNLNRDDLEYVTGGTSYAFILDGDPDDDGMENFGNEGLNHWDSQILKDATTNPHSKQYKNKKKNTLLR